MRWNLFPFLRYVIALSAGILLYHWGHFSFQTFLIISGTALIAFLGLQFTPVGIKWLGGLAGTVFFMGLGGLITHTSDEKLAINHFTPLQDSVIAYRAVLSSAVEKKPSTYRVIAEINAVKVRHEWRETQGKILLFIDRTVTRKPRYGDVWVIRKRPELVEPPSNPD
ncbi:DUF4131 domain-containing protein [Siphonobacter sp. SORGH_AS_1065]|uniref:DUF4131 domain-containing protein n=1 Tax=Siphonobacter sp. SORGH_AS_1065 TaxID=3041795 RepID=UPI002780C413|nr:DUF4131 domain-containing protein [Siphonobacter sp. SORGH_AS_1065]MDQ1089039.1 hypothetical protein [Siphonobacter sp. SORGH_AS_1065]